MAIKFNTVLISAKLPISSRISSGSMSKAEESFDSEIDSEASIKGSNFICICFDEEEALFML